MVRVSVPSCIRYGVGVLLVAVMLRTWLVLGLVEPVVVEGVSMLPALEPGERLWIDRTAYEFRDPARWEPVVLRQPDDPAGLCVKRVVGLPGESVTINGGEVCIDGVAAQKPLIVQRALRYPIHREQAPLKLTDSENPSWQFELPGGEPASDDVAENTTVSRRLNLVHEFAVSAEVTASRDARFAVSLDDGQAVCEVIVDVAAGSVEALDAQIAVADIAARFSRGDVKLEISAFDRKLIVALGAELVLETELAPLVEPGGVSRPVVIRARRGSIELAGLTIYRDVFYTPRAVVSPPYPPAARALGPGEYFLLGDNPAVSIDSRTWGPVREEWFVGRPLSAR